MIRTVKLLLLCSVLPSGYLRAEDPDGIMVERHGKTSQAYMLTNCIMKWLQPNVSYQVQTKNLRECAESAEKIAEAQTPAFVRVKAQWDSSESIQLQEASILGGFGTLTVDQKEAIQIPVANPTKEFFAYYGSSLVPQGGVVAFEANESLPLTQMTIGSEYADNYLMLSDFGGGFYLETHDRPHFHMPLDESSSGYLILGRMDGDYIELSAFPIPYGYSVYTPPEVIHNDGFLVGKYMVVYSVTENYSTVLLRSKQDDVISVQFQKNSYEG